MEYLDLIKKYWSLNKESPLGTSVTSIYFEISDNEISDILKMNRKTIRNGKDYLRNLGLISFQIKKGLTTFYKIIPDYTIRKSKDLPEIEKIIKKPVILETPISEQPEPISNIISFPEKIKIEQKINTTPIKNNNSPTMEEFMDFARSLEIYDESLDIQLKTKYDTWKNSNWINGYGNPILDWKKTLIRTIPFLKNGNKNIFSNSFPKINRPKNTYNE